MSREPSSKNQRAKHSADWWREDGDPDLQSKVHTPGEFLQEIIRLAGMADGVEEEKLRSMWARLVGDYIARGSVPDSLKRGVLTIRVAQPAMRFHLEQMKGGLLEKIRLAIGEDKIQALRFSQG